MAGFVYTGNRNKDQQKDGSGVFEASDMIYKGTFSNGLSHGLGVLQLGNKFRYRGNFKDGKFCGLGVLKVGGTLFEGNFLDGKIHGLGRMTFADGTHGLPIYEGVFQNGSFARSEKCDKIVSEAKQEAAMAEAGCTNFNHEQF